jgi:hypothetical protein
LGDNKNVLKQIMAMVIQFYEYTKNNWIVYFIWVTSVVCELLTNMF